MSLSLGKSFRVFSAVLLVFVAARPVAAQVDNMSNNLSYIGQYKDGAYTNADYSNMNITYADFYENLAPYGQWIADENYGYVFSPDVEQNFRPYYTNGHWAMTDYGNTWVSDYAWGWAAFHYGRWTYDSYYGWLWIPGSNWGPAWVSWRQGNGYLGWAPLYPGFEYSASELKKYNCPKDWWIFIPPQHVYTENYYGFYTAPLGNSTILKGTTFCDNTFVNDGITYFPGPTVMQVEKITGAPVKMHKLVNAGGPRAPFVHNELIKLFRPAEVKPTSGNGETIIPPNAINPGRPVAKPELVNTNAGMKPAFRNDLPRFISNTPRTFVPTKTITNTNNAAGNEMHRADNTEYRTDIKTPQPQRRGGSSSLKKPSAVAAPPQGSQAPEPVVLPQRNDPNKLPPTTQHNDPVPPLPAPNNNTPEPTPSQHPEPIAPGKR